MTSDARVATQGRSAFVWVWLPGATEPVVELRFITKHDSIAPVSLVSPVSPVRYPCANQAASAMNGLGSRPLTSTSARPICDDRDASTS